MSDTIPFKDNKGNVIRLKKSLTVKDLVKMGITMRILPEETPLPDNWYGDCERFNKNQ